MRSDAGIFWVQKKVTLTATYITELKNLAFKLKSLGEEINDTMVISKILTALPENYRFFVSAWELTPSAERTIINLTGRLLAEEANGPRRNSDKRDRREKMLQM